MKKKNKFIKAEMNLPKLIAEFGDEDKCRAYLERLRWPKGVTCPRCQSQNIAELPERDKYSMNGSEREKVFVRR